MSVRKNTNNRLILVRKCGTCGKEFRTSAASPFIRQLPRGGKKQATVYFCCESCFRASYKHSGYWDGKAEQRRREKEQSRDVSERNRRYYQAHAEEIKGNKKALYWQDQETAQARNQYNKKKRKLLEVIRNDSATSLPG